MTMQNQAAIARCASSDPVARLRDVDVTFGGSEDSRETRILRRFSLEVERGEFLVLLGRSGCGKTTILNLMAGLLTPSGGNIEIMGTGARAARSHIGYMFARDALIPSRNTLGNIEIGMEVRGLSKVDRRARAHKLIEKLGLKGAENRYPWQLSQGMRQRVALARTWALDPDLILMDEPFAALDPQTRESARQQFLELWERNRSSVVFVTHDLTEALLLGDRVMLLGAGGRVLKEVRLAFGRPRDTSKLPLTPEFRAIELELLSALTAEAA